jgi:RNA polymerase sigma-70 factor (sigma-E family)
MSVPEGVLSERSLAGEISERGAALTVLFDTEYPRLRGLAYVLLGDAHVAEEIAQEAFVRAFSSWTRMRDLDWPTGYLRKIVINLCRGRIRRQRIEARVNALVDSRPDPAKGWDEQRSDVRLDLWEAVRRLPERQRACIVLRYLEDMSDSEVARVLGCSSGTVKTHMSRARSSLERMLDGGLQEVIR